MATAIHNYIAAKFGRWDDNDNYIEPDVETVRSWALAYVRQYALDKIAELDTELQWGTVGTVLVMGEASRYLLANRPASPTPAQYAIANKWRVRRSETLADTLNWMADKYLVMYASTATIIDVWNEKITAIEAAATIDDIAAVLAALP